MASPSIAAFSRKVTCAALLALLTGCVAAEYHASGPNQFSVIAANQSCAHAFDPINQQYALGASFGLVGALATAAVELPSPEYANAQQTYDACMASYGWARN